LFNNVHHHQHYHTNYLRDAGVWYIGCRDGDLALGLGGTKVTSLAYPELL